MKMYAKKIWNSIFEVAYVAMSMIVAYFVVVMLLFALAFAVYKLRWQDSTVGLFIHGIYIFGGAIAGLIISRLKVLRSYAVKSSFIGVIIGICAGLIYVGLLFAISIILTGSTAYMKSEGLAVALMGICGCLLGVEIGYSGKSGEDSEEEDKKTPSQD
ncbi:MAG: YrzE family protein [Lachnospiraceae bacterium]|nr:YrzE family protein [Lachnospiraceae bacterium]